MSSSLLGLGPLESAIMALLWDAGDWQSIRIIRDEMDYRRVSYSTVASVADILYRKGQVRRRRVAGVRRGGPPGWQYRAARPLSEQIGELIGALLDCSPDPEGALRHALGAQPGRALNLHTIPGDEQ